MKFFKIYFPSLAVTFLLFSCGIDRPDMSGDSDYYTHDSDIYESEQPDDSRSTDDSDSVSDDTKTDFDNDEGRNQQNDADSAGKNDRDESEDCDFSGSEDFDSSPDDDLDGASDFDSESEDCDLSEDEDRNDYPDYDFSEDEDFDSFEDEDLDETADFDELNDSDFPAIPDADFPQFVNGDMQDWTDDSVVGWKKSDGAVATLVLEKEDSGGGNFALRVTQPQNSKNKPGFESEKFETDSGTPLPLRIEFRVKTGCRSKIAAELVCGGNSLKYKYVDETKTFIKSGNYVYNQIELPQWTNLSLEFKEEMTQDFWKNQLCRLLFRTGSGTDFDTSFDDFRIIY